MNRPASRGVPVSHVSGTSPPDRYDPGGDLAPTAQARGGVLGLSTESQMRLAASDAEATSRRRNSRIEDAASKITVEARGTPNILSE